MRMRMCMGRRRRGARSVSKYTCNFKGSMYMRVRVNLMFVFYSWITQEAHGLYSIHYSLN